MVDGIEIAAVCDDRPGRAQQVAEECGADRSCEDFADILSMADVDVVDICTPPTLHAPMAISALSAGKAVICEKPMSSDLESAARMAATAIHLRPDRACRGAQADCSPPQADAGLGFHT
jgi:predicted dehydrogenase